MTTYFSRYPAPRIPRESFMQHSLRQASSAQREALLQAINFDIPDHAMSGTWEHGGQALRADLQSFHPLSSIAKLGDEDLFDRALVIAHEHSSQPIYLNDRREMVTLSDWTASGVLNAVVAYGSVPMLKSLVAKLMERPRLTRQLQLSPNNEGPNPWQALAKEGDRALPSSHYRDVLKILDQYLRACHRQNFNTSRGKKPSSDGAPPLTAWEKRMRGAVYTHALAQAATACNPPMMEAILQTGYAVPEISHIQAAICAGGLDMASRLMETGYETLMGLPLGTDRRHHDRYAGPRATLSAEEVEHALVLLGKTVALWEAVDEESAPDLAPWRSHQLQYVDRLFWPLLELRARFLQGEQVPEGLKDPATQLVPGLLPILVHLEADDARRAHDHLAARCPEVPVLALLPSLEQWSPLFDASPCAWQELQCARMAALSPEDAKTYLKRLATDLEAAWINPDGTSFDPLEVLGKVWPAAPNPSLPPVFEWVQQVLTKNRAGLGKARHAELHNQLLEHAVPRVSGRGHAGPRL